MNGWQAAALVTLVTVGGLLVGCQSEAELQTPLRSDLEERRLNDIDVPAGFSLDGSKSWFLAEENIRRGYLRYKGRPSVNRTIEFFLTQMQAHNWTLLDQSENHGTSMLVFTKGPERCTMSLFRDWGTTHVTVRLTKQGR